MAGQHDLAARHGLLRGDLEGGRINRQNLGPGEMRSVVGAGPLWVRVVSGIS